MLYLCLPAYNEGPTVGLVLWNIHKVFSAYSREYEILVVDDGSDDATADTLETYGRLLPLTVIRNETRRGYAAAIDSLARTAAARTRYPRRDAVIFMQADFSDPPEALPDLVKRFEGGSCPLGRHGWLASPGLRGQDSPGEDLLRDRPPRVGDLLEEVPERRVVLRR